MPNILQLPNEIFAFIDSFIKDKWILLSLSKKFNKEKTEYFPKSLPFFLRGLEGTEVDVSIFIENPWIESILKRFL